MKESENIPKQEALMLQYINIKADVIIGKNLSKHLPIVENHIVKLSSLAEYYILFFDWENAIRCHNIILYYDIMKEDIIAQLGS
jgi:hypothetical protein